MKNFGTKLGLPNAAEVTFSDFARKIQFGRFWPIFIRGNSMPNHPGHLTTPQIFSPLES